MDIFLNFVTSFFASAGLVVALFALVGSLILKRGVTKTIISTFMSALGFFILSIGAGAMGSALTHFQKEFSVILGYGNDTGNQGNAIVADSNTFAVGIMFFSSRISAVASIMLLLAIVFNLLLAKFSNFKNIYLSTHILMYFSIGFTSVFQLCGCDLGLDKMGLVVALLGAMLLATYSTMAPSISTKISFEVMGEKNINLCHHDLFSFQIASWIGSLIGKLRRGKFKSAEKLNLPKWCHFLKETNITTIFIMALMFLIVYCIAYGMHPNEAHKAVDGTSLGVAIVVDAISFSAGIMALIYGVQMMVNELKTCIQGITDKFIKGAHISVDASLIIKYRPTAVLIGFLTSFLGGLIITALSFVFHNLNPHLVSAVVLPSNIVLFFLGATAGTFGDVKGGTLGAAMAGFIVGIVVTLLPILFMVLWNTLSPGIATQGITHEPYWWNNPNWNWDDRWNADGNWLNSNDAINNPHYTAVSSFSYGESDYILINIIGWIMYSTNSHLLLIGNIVVNPMIFGLFVLVIIIWTIIILLGQLRRKKPTNRNIAKIINRS